jgi:hypothetical protein
VPDLANLVRVASATTGTGTLTLGSAMTGFLTPTQAGTIDGLTYSYAIEADYVTVGDDSVPTSREVGHGVMGGSGTTLTRSVLNSTNSNALLNLAGDAQVTISVTTENFMLGQNLIINGGMEIDQINVGAAQTGLATGVRYVLDQWEQQSAGAVVVTAQQVTDAPPGFEKSLKISVTTADTSIAAGDYCVVFTVFEGLRWARLGFGAAGASSVAIAFKVKAHRTGTYTGGLVNAAATRSYTFEFTVNAADTWEYKSVVIPGDTTGTWQTGNVLAAYLLFGMAAGSTFQTAAGSWAAGNFFATSNQINGVAATTDTFQICGVAVVPGTVPVPEALLPHWVGNFDEELLACQRYYEKSFAYATVPAAGTTGIFSGNLHFTSYIGGAAVQRPPSVQFKVRKRAAGGTITLYNPSAAGNQIRDFDAAANCTSSSGSASETEAVIECVGAAGTAVTNRLIVHWTVDARM